MRFSTAAICAVLMIFKTAQHYGQALSLPWNEDFESVSLCGESIICDESCTLGNGWTNEENSVQDDIDWRSDQNGTETILTGPSTDHTLGTSTGTYLYLESSGGCNNLTASLISPLIDLTTAKEPELTLWYHVFGITQGELHLDIIVENDTTYDISTPIVGDQGNSWYSITQDLSSWIGNNVQLQIRGITGVNFRSDIAIDDISIIETYIPIPPISILETSSQLACIGDNITFESHSTGDIDSIAWSFNSTTYPEAYQLSTHNITVANEDTIIVNLFTSGPAGTSLAQDTIIVHPPLQVSLSYSSHEICEGDNLLIALQGDAVDQVQWYNELGILTGEIGPTFSVSTPHTYFATVQKNGCEAITQDSLFLSVLPNVIPQIDLNLTEGNNPSCANATLLFETSIEYAGNSPIYQWFKNGEQLDHNGPIYEEDNLLDQDTIQVRLVSSEKCATPKSSLSSAIVINRIELQTPTITISTNDNPSCANSLITTSALFTAGGNDPIINWYLNNQQIATGTMYSSSILQDGDVLHASLLSNEVCLISNNVVSNTITVERIQSNADLTANVNHNPNCANFPSTFNPVFGEEFPQANFEWFKNGALVSEEKSYTDLTTQTDDEYYIKMTVTSGCTSGQVLISDTIKMNIIDQNSPYTIVGEEYPLCGNNTEVYETEFIPNISYNWNVPLDAKILSGQGSSKITVQFGTQIGQVNVVRYTTPSCQGPTEALVVQPCITNSLETIPKTSLPFISPSISSNRFHFNHNGQKLNSIRIYSIQGRFIESFPLVNEEDSFDFGSTYPSGQYLVHIQKGDFTHVYKIVKL